ncbi:unnamed protein product [Pedinophyceae sp. YPF-701]|nr:unnamed protein product [Pedinophyceae sp. YPF-701]
MGKKARERKKAGSLALEDVAVRREPAKDESGDEMRMSDDEGAALGSANPFGFLAAGGDDVDGDKGADKGEDLKMDDDADIFGLKAQRSQVSARQRKRHASRSPGVALKLTGKRGNNTMKQRRRKLQAAEKAISFNSKLGAKATRVKSKALTRKKLSNLY